MRFSHLSLFIILGIFFNASAQEKSFYYKVELSSGLSSNDSLPFWMTANNFGKIPHSNYALTTTTFGKNFNENKDFSTAFKGAVTGTIADENKAIINELYASLRYKKFQLDIGSKNDEIVFEGLSSSNGNITKSINARAIPGYTLSTIDFIKLPFAKKWLTFKANYGDYLLNDERYVEDVRLHMKSLFFKSQLKPNLDLIVGLNHYAQWAGTSPVHGKQPSGFKNYIKVITGSAGGSDATKGDQINVLGNQLGSYLIQLNYKGEKTNWNFYISHPFEDRSGRELMNYPDNIYGFFLDFKKEKAFITHALAELTYTKHRSGTTPHANGQAASGRDEYFNNGVYQSGWTYFNQVIGTPFIFPKQLNDSGIALGANLDMNRFIAYHIGIKGFLGNSKYKAFVNYINFDNWFESNGTTNYYQYMGHLEIYPELKKIPFQISCGASFDITNYTSNNIGGFLRLTKKGLF